MSTPVFEGSIPYVYFTCDRDPTATEPDVASVGIPSNWLFYWWNTTSKNWFVFHGGSSGSMIWKEAITPQNISSFLVQADWTQSNSGATDFIKNKPVARSQASASRTLNSAFQISATRDSLVNYSVDISCTLNLTTGEIGTVFLEIASDSGFTSNVQELSRIVNGETGTLALGLNLTQSVTGVLSGFVPSGYYCRIRTANTSGTPQFTYGSGQEILL